MQSLRQVAVPVVVHITAYDRRVPRQDGPVLEGESVAFL